MVNLKQLFKDLKESLSTAEQDAERLNTDEEKEMKYLNREDVPRSLEIFSEEVDLAVQLTEHLENAEEDELQAEKFLKDSDVPEEIRERFMESEQEVEGLVKKALDEMQTLKKEAEMLEGQIQSSDVPQEAVEEYRSDKQELKQALNNMQEVQQEGEMMISRRNALGVIAGAAAGSAWAMNRKINQISRKAEKLIEQRERRLEETQRATKKEASKPNTEVKGGKDHVMEQISIGEDIYARLNVVRTSPTTALTYIEIQNRSNQKQKLELELSPENWEITTVLNFSSDRKNKPVQTVELTPESNFEAGGLLRRTSSKAGRVKYKVSTGKQSETMRLNPPAKTSMNSVKPEDVSGVEIEYRRETDSKKADQELKFSMENTSGQKLNIQATLILPGGWTAEGFENLDSSGAGMYSISSDLRNRAVDGFNLYISKEATKASKAAALSVAVIDDKQPEKIQDYIIPVALEQ